MSRISISLVKGIMSFNGATPWYGNISLGNSAPVSFRWMFDTGTYITWITGSTCTTNACEVHNKYDFSQSPTWIWKKKNIIERFGPWGTITADYGEELFSLPTASVRATLDIASAYEGEQFTLLDCDGGIGFPSLSEKTDNGIDDRLDILSSLYKMGVISKRIVSFAFDSIHNRGVCVLGEEDSTLFIHGLRNTVPLFQNELKEEYHFLWTVKLDGFFNDTVSQNIASTVSMLCLDTGSSCFKGSPAVINSIRDQILSYTDNSIPLRRSEIVQERESLKSYPNITLVINDFPYHLSPEQYFVQLSESLWALGFQPMEGLPDNLLLAGSLFLDTVYVSFNADSRSVTLSKPSPIKPELSEALILGSWQNEFSSKMIITEYDQSTGVFSGMYSSTTGATGTYRVIGLADPYPKGTGQSVSFSVSWRDINSNNSEDFSYHWASSFTGTLYIDVKSGLPVLDTQYILQQDPASAPSWIGSSLYSAHFKRL